MPEIRSAARQFARVIVVVRLVGLLRHMTEVERAWFRRRFAGEPVEQVYASDQSPDADFESTPARATTRSISRTSSTSR